tara:strand:- start:645 stop:1118 length:474 start_codon:yes stop_codon:yes gene_type:complete
MKKIFSLVLFLVFLFSGCTVSDSQMKSTSTNTGIKLDSEIKEIIFLNDHKINSKLTVELINRGIKVKPFISQQKVTEAIGENKIEYNEAATRYGLRIEDDFKQVCVFSSNQNNDFTFTLIDIRTNDIVNIFQKRGPNGKCPPLTPIYITYANYLSNL